MIKLLLITFLMSVCMLKGDLTSQSFWDMKPEEVRKMFNDKAFAIKAETPEVQNVKNITIKQDGRTTPLRIYIPNESENLPIILFIHGGAWIAGNLDTHDNLARYLCRGAQAIVVSVEYLNAPEGKFPLALEQCNDALLWIVQHAQEFHADKSRLAVVGDSAGGNIAAALCLFVRDRKGPAINLQVLINPVIDPNTSGTIQRQGDAHDNERWYTTQYVRNAEDLMNPYVSPLKAKELTNLPPALILLAEKDDFRKDGQKYADRLRDAGIATNTYTQWGVGHLAGNGARASALARESLDVAVAALRGAFYRKDS
jgi:acetyl esterase